MAVAYVKIHTVVTEKVLDTSASVTVDTGGIAAGNLIVLAMVFDNAGTASKPVISSITKMSGETATWVSLGAARSTSTSIGAFSSGELWAIKTTVAWTAGTYTITLDTAVTQKAAAFLEFSGAEATLRSTVGTGYSTTTTVAAATTTGTTPVIGDLAVGFVFSSNQAGAPGGDSDTTGGAWSTSKGVGSTGGSAATNNYGSFQYKILTGANHQAYSASAGTAGNGAIAAILRATPDPAVTQAAYRLYADGEEPTLADTWDISNLTGTAPIGPTASAGGQSFTGNGQKLVLAGFGLQKTGTPNGTVWAELYAHAGTFGSSSVGTGSPLATSTTVINTTSISTSMGWVDFDFDGTYTLTNGTPYVIVVKTDNTGTNFLQAIDATQAHAGSRTFFASGSWSASAANDAIFRVYTASSLAALAAPLAAQDTAATADLSSGDVNLQVRVRLQETGSGATLATDDWQLQYEKNTSGTWAAVTASGLIEYTTLTSASSGTTVTGGYYESFLGNGLNLTQAEFNLRRDVTVTGDVTAILYAHTGTYGTTSAGTGSALATSTTRAKSTLDGTVYVWEPFDFDGTFTLANGTPYVIGITATGTGNIDNRSDAAGTHPGSGGFFNGTSTWTPMSDDFLFKVHTTNPTNVVPYASASLTDAAATTNRLTGGSGTFTAGEISETGLVTNLGWSTSNHTELLYSLTLKQADLANSDVLKFRVLRNGATTGLTYTQTPTINVTVGAGVPSGTGTGGYAFDRTTAIGYKLPKGSTTVGTYAWNRTTATGAKVQRGTATTGTYAWDRTAATGVAPVTPKTGTATGIYTWTGNATGLAPAVGVKAGTAMGAYVWARTTATGYVLRQGTAAGAYSYAGTATGAKVQRGSSTGSYAFNRTTATGTRTPKATSSGTYNWTGTAAGTKAPRGAAVGAYAYAGTATGTRVQRGTAAGSYAFNRTTATGTKTTKGTAAGTYLWARTTATGTRTPKATSSGSYNWSGSGTGYRLPKGTSTTGTYNWAGVATGIKPIPGVKQGTAQGFYVFARTTAHASTTRQGTSSGTYLWARTTATGSKTQRGTAAGTYLYAGTSTGKRTPKATAVGNFNWTRTTATGKRTPKATAVGAYLYAGVATGTTPGVVHYVEDFDGNPAQVWVAGIRLPIQTF